MVIMEFFSVVIAFCMALNNKLTFGCDEYIPPQMVITGFSSTQDILPKIIVIRRECLLSDGHEWLSCQKKHSRRSSDLYSAVLIIGRSCSWRSLTNRVVICELMSWHIVRFLFGIK
ncbi:hypothetical protein AVEN_241179-1 [Araneus ventricosus]|uniref:Uncharacterized protein n=1 Tax=Araneus ventricosus TaxID=182803 RepID=A0A4Y2G023_ARAVE|nr:hypothetical protein AVEN_241179-1 [Araneus ventricosus]